MAGLSGKGRQRTQTRMIQGADARQVAFSKRRSGLFKKASELCTLCAVETALVIFSPGGKAFSFGHPGVVAIMNRLANGGKPDLDEIRRAEAEQEATLRELNKQYADLLEKVEAEKLRNERLKQMRMLSQGQGETLIDRPVDELSFEELLKLKSMLEGFDQRLKNRMRELSSKPADSTPKLAGESDASLGGSTEGDCSANPHDHDVGCDH